MSMSATEDRKPSSDTHPEMHETFDALEGVADLRPSKIKEPQPAPHVDTSRLLAATGDLAALKGRMSPRELAKRIAAKEKAEANRPASGSAITPSYKRRPWKHNGLTLILLGITGILAVGLVTLIVLMLMGNQ